MEEATKLCPYCGEEIIAAAKKCKHCGKWLDEPPAIPKASDEQEAPAAGQEATATEKATKPCPCCGEEILATAKKCKHCGEWLDRPHALPEASNGQETTATEKATKLCPYCGEEIKTTATKCKHCGEWLDKPPASPEPPKDEGPRVVYVTEESGGFWGCLKNLAIWGVVILVAWLTLPSESRHLDKLEEDVTESAKKRLRNYANRQDAFTSLVCNAMLDNGEESDELVRKLVRLRLDMEIKDYKVISFGVLTDKKTGEQAPASVALFGMVFPFSDLVMQDI